MKIHRITETARAAHGFPVALTELAMSGAVDSDRPGEIQIRIEDPAQEGVWLTLSLAEIAAAQTFATALIEDFMAHISGQAVAKPEAVAKAPATATKSKTKENLAIVAAKATKAPKPEPTEAELDAEVAAVEGAFEGGEDEDQAGANGEAPPPPAEAKPAKSEKVEPTKTKRTRRTRQQIIDDAKAAKAAAGATA